MRRRRWRTLGVRGRAVLAGVVVVAVALAGGSAALLVLLNRTLVADLDSGAVDRAAAVGTQLTRGGPSSLPPYLAATTPVGQLVQVLDAGGTVVASSGQRAAGVPLSTRRPAPGQVVRTRADRVRLLDIDDAYLVVAEGVTTGGRDYTVLVATSLRSASQSVRAVFTLLALGSPALLLLLGLAIWFLVGQALAPVERIRARVAQIGGSRLDERVPVPAASDEITRLATTMNRMLDRLERSASTQRQFVADAGHELRSPLTTLTAALDVAAVRHPEGWPELRAAMAGEAARMARLVDDLLLLARSDDTGMRLRVADVDLDDLVAEEAARLRPGPGPGIRSSPQPARVRGDEAKLAQLLRNLTDNAVRHARSRVDLASTAANGLAELVVDDDGPGIPAADRRRVFERFVRLETARDRGTGGSGLGLAIVREIAQAHGGTVTISDSPLGGTRVTVRLPATGAPGAR